jgi:hypothetical protein
MVMRTGDERRVIGAGGSLPPAHEAWLPQQHSLYRPRHGGRQLTALLCALVFFGGPLVAAGFGVRPDEIENRPLVGFPGVAGGWHFLTDMSQWATDHLVLRGAAVSAADGVSRTVFGEPAPLAGGDGQTGAQSGPLAPLAGKQPPVPYPKVIEGKNGWLYYGLDIESKCRPVRRLDQTMAALRRLRKIVESSGRQFVLLVPPDKTTAVPENLPDSYLGSGCAAAVSPEFWRRVTADAGAVDMRDALSRTAASLGRPVYYPMDSHWNTDGGIVLARTMAEAITPGISAGWSMSPTSEFTTDADLPKLINRGGQDHGVNYSLKPDGQHDNVKPTWLRAEERPVAYTTQAGPGIVNKRVGIVCDSFAIPAAPYIAASVTNPTFVNSNVLLSDPNSMIDMLTQQQVVVVENVERGLTGGFATFLAPDMLDRIQQALAAHPIR